MSKETAVATRTERASGEATLTSKGQVTVPVAIRTDMGVQTGDRLRFDRIGKDRFVVTPVRRTDLSKVAGILANAGRRLETDEISSLRKLAAQRRARKLDEQR